MSKRYFMASGLDGDTVYKRTRRGDVEVARYSKDSPRSGNGQAYELTDRLNHPLSYRSRDDD